MLKKFMLIALATTMAVTFGGNPIAHAQTGLASTGNGGFFGSFDYLHWTVRSADVEYGVTDIGGVQDRGPVGQVLSLGNDYESGYRFSTGYRLVNGPEFLFQFTDFDSTLSETYAGPLRSIFVSSDNGENNDSDDGVNDVTPDDRATQAVASRSFDYQVYDFELGQTLALTDSMSVRLSGGARIANVDQAFNATYTGGDFQTAFSAFKTGNYDGGGIIAGGDLIWHLLPSTSINVGTNFGMMLGNVETRVFIPDDEPGVPTDVTFDESRLTPVMEMSVGLNWSRSFGSYLVSLASGYEMTNWFNLSDTRVFTDAYMEAQNAHLIGDVSLDGAYVRIALNR